MTLEERQQIADTSNLNPAFGRLVSTVHDKDKLLILLNTLAITLNELVDEYETNNEL